MNDRVHSTVVSPAVAGENRRQREMIFFMQLGASCAARADQHGSSLGALGLRQLAQRYLTIAAGFAGDEDSAVTGHSAHAQAADGPPGTAIGAERSAA